MARVTRSWSPAQIVVVAAGVLFVVFGAFAVARGGLSSPQTTPVVQVFGFDHTPLLGLIELGTGAALVLAGLSPRGRTVSFLVGILLAIAGVLVLGQVDWVKTHLAAPSSFGWIPLISGGVIVVTLMVSPQVHALPSHLALIATLAEAAAVMMKSPPWTLLSCCSSCMAGFHRWRARPSAASTLPS